MIKIGVSAAYFHADPLRAVFKGKTLLYMEQSLSHWLSQGGAFPILLPSLPSGKKNFTDWVEELDALILQGGSDVSPKTYGETPLKPEWSGDAVRDAYEIALIKEFMAQNKPILGVCRGLQIMNVAFGGTLFQDIETQATELGPLKPLNHRNWEIYDQNFHTVSFEPGYKLAALYKVNSGTVNTIHHQAVKDLASVLEVEARSEQDGIVEAVRHKQFPEISAIQWHPEFQDENDISLLAGQVILKDFLAAAQKKRTKT